MRWENPQSLIWIFGALAFYLGALFLQNYHWKKLKSFFPVEKNFLFLTQEVSLKARKINSFLLFLTVVLALLALARCQSGGKREKISTQGIELMLVVDVSESMMAEDVNPNRLEQVKNEMNRLTDLLPGSRIGLIAFAGSASLLSPLTSDPVALKMYIDSLGTTSVSSQGTNVSAALREAMEALERGSEESQRLTQAIVVASDGEDHEPGAFDVAKKLEEKKIKIFTLAYGTEKGAPIPERDDSGFLRGYKKDREGKTILTTVKGEFLKKISESAGGTFYHAAFAGDHIKKIVSDLEALQKSQIQSEMVVQFEENYQIFLMLAIGVALLEIFRSDRKKKSRFWKGRFEVNL